MRMKRQVCFDFFHTYYFYQARDTLDFGLHVQYPSSKDLCNYDCMIVTFLVIVFKHLRRICALTNMCWLAFIFLISVTK